MWTPSTCASVCVENKTRKRSPESASALEQPPPRSGGSEVAAHIVPIWKPLFQLCSTKADHNEVFVRPAKDPCQVNNAAFHQLIHSFHLKHTICMHFSPYITSCPFLHLSIFRMENRWLPSSCYERMERRSRKDEGGGDVVLRGCFKGSKWRESHRGGGGGGALAVISCYATPFLRLAYCIC